MLILHFSPSLHFTLSLQSAFYTQSAFYPWSAVCSPPSAFYTDRIQTPISWNLWTFYFMSRLILYECVINVAVINSKRDYADSLCRLATLVTRQGEQFSVVFSKYLANWLRIWEGCLCDNLNKTSHKYPTCRIPTRRLRVVPHFYSGIVGRAKRERAWKSPHARKGDTRRWERKMKL